MNGQLTRSTGVFVASSDITVQSLAPDANGQMTVKLSAMALISESKS